MKRTFDDELNEIRRRAGLKEQTRTESSNFTAYTMDKEKGRWEFGIPRKWMEPEIFKIPYEQIDHGRYINDPDYEKEVVEPNPEYRPELMVNIGHGHDKEVMTFLRDVVGLSQIDPDEYSFLVPTKEFVWKVKAWQQKPQKELSPEIPPSDSHDPDSPRDPRWDQGAFGDLLAPPEWERKREGNVVDLKKSPKGARVIGMGREEGYVEKQVLRLLKVAELALEMDISHVGMSG